MRFVFATAMLFPVALLATSQSSTESADLSNKKLALGLTMDQMAAAEESPDQKSMEDSTTKVSVSAPETNYRMEFSATPESNEEMTQEMAAESIPREQIAARIAQSVDELRATQLKGETRSPVFIPEFSAASPWANVAPPETMDAEPSNENASWGRNAPVSAPEVILSRAMPPAISPPRVPVPTVRASVPETSQWSEARTPAARDSDVRVLVRVPEGAANPLPAPTPDRENQVSARNVLPVLRSEARTASDSRHSSASRNRIPQGTAKDLLPVGEGESGSPSNSLVAIAVTPPPNNSAQRIAQTRSDIYRPNPQDVQIIEEKVQNLEENAVVEDSIAASPSLTIVNPTGYGADNNTGYLSGTYQSRVRNTESDDAAFALGFGFGDARENLGVELSYTFASLGTRRDFGTGGFNVKLHRQFANDWAIAAGWNGFVSTGDYLDGFEDSVYGVVSKVIRTQESINSPFSRVALSAGVGNGQFRSADALEKGKDGVNVFGSVAVRVAQPVSAIVEWTGQDLAVGASIAPFKNVPFVITPAVRDIAGTGDGARLVLGAGVGFRF
jgi:hypothetical protein